MASKVSTLQDRFNLTSLQTSLWNQYTAGSATMSYASGGATCNYPASSTSATDGDITSNSTYDLTGSRISLKVTAVPSTSTKADATFSFTDNSFNNILAWLYEANGSGTGYLYAQQVVSGTQTNLLSITYNSTTHKYWSIREKGGTIYWETSSDGINWTTQYSKANPITTTSLYANIGGSCYENETSPGVFTWSNFNFLPISVVQRAVNTQTGYTGTVSKAFTSNTQGGSAIVVLVADNTNTSDINTPTDSQSNTYTQLFSALDASNYYGYKAYIAYNASAAANTVTVTNTSYQPLALMIYEVSGLSANPFDVSALNKGDVTTTPSSGSITTNYANELLLGLNVTNASSTETYTAGSGYSNLQQSSYVNGLQVASEEKIVSSTGSQSATFSMSGNNGLNMTAMLALADTYISQITKTQTGISRIANNLTKTQTGKSRIANNLTKTQPAKSRIQVTVTKTQTAIAKVQVKVTKTQSAIATISQSSTLSTDYYNVTYVIPGSNSETAIARIAQNLTNTITAISRIAINPTKTQPAVSRIRVNLTKNQTGKASMKAGRTYTQSATANVYIQPNYKPLGVVLDSGTQKATETSSATGYNLDSSMIDETLTSDVDEKVG